jgi:hypothetical protein
MDAGRIKHGHRIPVVKVATGLVTGDERLSQRRMPTFDPSRAFRPIWQGIVEKEKTSFGHYSDGLVWELQAEIARSSLEDEALPDGFVMNATGQAISAKQVAQVFHGEYWKPGMTLQSNSVRFEDGKLVRHADEHTFYNSRGIQFDWISAGLLPEFRNRNAAWDALGVVGDEGKVVTQFAFPWNIFHLTTKDENYGLCTQQTPWTPTARGRTLALVCVWLRACNSSPQTQRGPVSSFWKALARNSGFGRIAKNGPRFRASRSR